MDLYMLGKEWFPELLTAETESKGISGGAWKHGATLLQNDLPLMITNSMKNKPTEYNAKML